MAAFDIYLWLPQYRLKVWIWQIYILNKQHYDTFIFWLSQYMCGIFPGHIFARLSSSPRPPPIELKAFAMELGMFLTRHHPNGYVEMTSLTT